MGGSAVVSEGALSGSATAHRWKDAQPTARFQRRVQIAAHTVDKHQLDVIEGDLQGFEDFRHRGTVGHLDGVIAVADLVRKVARQGRV